MPSRRSTTGHDSSPPFGPAAPPRDGAASPLPRLAAPGGLTSFACAGPTMPSAACCEVVREDGSALSPAQDTSQIARGQRSSRRSIDAGLIKHRPSVDGGLGCGVPARPGGTTPPVRCVVLVPPGRSPRPSAPTSRCRPCPARVLRLHVSCPGRRALPSMTACTAHTLGLSHALQRVGSRPWFK